VGVIRRTVEPHASVAFPCNVRTQHLNQGGFANAGFPTEEHHLSKPRLTLLPASQEKPEFLLTPYQERQPGRGRLSPVTRRLPMAEDAEDSHGLCHAFELMYPYILQSERAVEQARRHSTQHHRIRGCQALEARRNVGGIAQGELFLACPTADGANDHDPGVQAQADRHTHPVLQHQTGIQRCHDVHNGQPGAHCPLGGIFVRLGIAKVDEQAIARVLRHIAVKGLDRRHCDRLVGAHHGPIVFRIQLLSEARRANQIAKHHRELTAFGVRGGRGGCEESTVDQVV
jgi:hypothetical protein